MQAEPAVIILAAEGASVEETAIPTFAARPAHFEDAMSEGGAEDRSPSGVADLHVAVGEAAAVDHVVGHSDATPRRQVQGLTVDHFIHPFDRFAHRFSPSRIYDGTPERRLEGRTTVVAPSPRNHNFELQTAGLVDEIDAVLVVLEAVGRCPCFHARVDEVSLCSGPLMIRRSQRLAVCCLEGSVFVVCHGEMRRLLRGDERQRCPLHVILVTDRCQPQLLINPVGLVEGLLDGCTTSCRCFLVAVPGELIPVYTILHN